MKHADEIKRFVKNTKINTNSNVNEAVLNGLLEDMDKVHSVHANAKPNPRRIIMNRPFIKLATAAVVIIAVALSINLLDRTATPAWAIEESIALLRNFNALHCTGTTLENGKEVSVEVWAKANNDQTASDRLRLETATGSTSVVFGSICHRYDPNTNIVNVIEGYGPAMSPWVGADFFDKLKKTTFDWKETFGTDPATGRDRVFVTCSHLTAGDGTPRSWWFEFDIESKLLVSMKQWDNYNRTGTPEFNIKSITYFENLPDELFTFEIPEGATVVSGLPERAKKLQDPNSGVPVCDSTEIEACKEIARRYWQAIIDNDWQTVEHLRPIADAQTWESKYGSINFQEIVEIGEPYKDSGCNIGKIVPCVIKFNDITDTIELIVMFRGQNEQITAVIAGTWGIDINK